MAAKKKALLVQEIHPAGIAKLAPEVEIVMAKSAEPDKLINEVADVDAIILRLTPLPAAVINAAPKLKVIGRPGVGYDNVDLAAATARGIPVVYAPGSNDISVAEHTVGLLVALAKQFVKANTAVKVDNNFQFRHQVRTVELRGKTVGIVGFGNIGRTVAHICREGFGMKIVTYDKFITDEFAAQHGAKRLGELDELLAAADFVSLHVPSTKENYHMIGGDQLRKMKPTACLINTARGTVVDEAALAEAVAGKSIAGAATDVFEKEPPVADNPLLVQEGIIVTPHMAAHSEESMARMATMMADGVLDVLAGRTPRYIAR